MASPDYAYMKKWRLDRDRGVTRLIDAGPAVAHVRGLLAAGWSLRSIADAAGVAPAVVLKLKKARQEKISRPTAAKVLTVTPERLRSRGNADGFVLKVGAVRRIEALLAVGHRHSDITAAMVALDPAVGTRSPAVLHQRGTWIARATHDCVAAAYEQLAMIPGPSGKTRRLAAKYGYAPPLAWDEDTIDDPAAAPAHQVDAEEPLLDELEVEWFMAGVVRKTGFHTPAELIEAVRRLAAAGFEDLDIATRIGMTRAAVFKIRKRNDIPAAAPVERTA